MTGDAEVVEAHDAVVPVVLTARRDPAEEVGQLATRVITPRLGVRARFVPGPPKRFAQGTGAVVSVTAAILALGFGLHLPAYVVLSILVLAAGLEAALGFCVGCRIFALLMRTGVVPEEVCERCRDLGFGSRTGGDDRIPMATGCPSGP